MASYMFWLASVDIHTTRSREKDTNTISMSLKVGDTDYGPVLYSMGDCGRGHYDVPCQIGPIEIPDPNTQVTLSYLITNGATAQEAQERDLLGQAAKGVITYVIGKGVAAIPLVGSFLSVPAGLLAAQLGNAIQALLSANCDGIVAGNGLAVSLPSLANTGTLDQTQNYPGTDSPHGCGANSNYDVRLIIADMNYQPPPPPTATLSVRVSPYPMPLLQQTQITVLARDPLTLNPVAADVYQEAMVNPFTQEVVVPEKKIGEANTPFQYSFGKLIIPDPHGPTRENVFPAVTVRAPNYQWAAPPLGFQGDINE